MRRGRQAISEGIEERRTGIIAQPRPWFSGWKTHERRRLSYGGYGKEPSFARRLAEKIWRRLPYCGLERKRPGNSVTLVHAYAKSLEEFHYMQNDVTALFHAVMQSNIEFRQEHGPTNRMARDQALAAKLQEMLTRVPLAWDPPVNVISATVISKPLDELHRVLLASLREAVSTFAQNFEQTCEQLCEQDLLGTISWINDTTCEVRFGRQLIVQANDGVVDWNSQVVGNVQHVQEYHRGRHIYRVTDHEHLVMDANAAAVQSGDIALPPRAQRVADVIPEWLMEDTSVVGGLLVKGDITEHDIGQADWSNTTNRVIVPAGPDPAIVLDRWVLTGWNPPEAELDPGWHVRPVPTKPSRATRDEAQRQYAWWVSGAALFATVQGLICGAFPAIGNSVWLGMFTAVSALAAMWSVHLQRQAANSTAQLHHYVTALFISFGLIGGSAMLALGARLASSPDIGAGVALMAASVSTILLAPLWWRTFGHH